VIKLVSKLLLGQLRMLMRDLFAVANLVDYAFKRYSVANVCELKCLWSIPSTVF